MHSGPTTPKKNRIQGICDFLDHKKIPYSHSDVFRFEGVSHTTGWKILREPRELEGRTFHSTHAETRGRKRKLTDKDVDALADFVVKNDGHDARTLQWHRLPAEAGLDIDVSGETVRRHMRARGFRRCQACRETFVPPRSAKQRPEDGRVTRAGEKREARGEGLPSQGGRRDVHSGITEKTQR
ncbi:hmg box protein [Ophiostoma piceae UAMH 11346]|uniref:Hmg box protein n=1 Tax=Ophiostoma piceae (strain UAMH 11346) TaxID=1262450 RepID=S3BPY0_OPHP1|nr:hmg box protein [Ophiostoma piceae UAMH 11346]